MLQVVCRPTCFEDLKTVNGILHNTYTDAAVALKLMFNDNLWRKTLLEASAEMSTKRIFALVLIHCNPGNKLELFNDVETFKYLSSWRWLTLAQQKEKVLQRLYL